MDDVREVKDDNHTFIHPKSGEVHSMTITMNMVRDMVMDTTECTCSGPCECTVEPDGTCPNGWPSVLVALGVY